LFNGGGTSEPELVPPELPVNVPLFGSEGVSIDSMPIGYSLGIGIGPMAAAE
jgi:hypothetical protein